MRNYLGAGAALIVFGCSPAADAPAAPETTAGPAATIAAAPRDGCKDVASVIAAMAEPEPFSSLRTGKVKLGDREVDDMFITDISPAGAACQLGVMDGFQPGSARIYVANCKLFSSGMLERAENAVKAKTAFDKARETLDACVPKDWTSRDGAQPGADTTESMVYESEADSARSMDASFYAYPVELKKEWSEGGQGEGPGWRVTLNFQKEGPPPAATSPATPQ